MECILIAKGMHAQNQHKHIQNKHYFIIGIHLKEPTPKRGSSMCAKKLVMHPCFQGSKRLCLRIYILMIQMYDYSTHCLFLVDYWYANLIRYIKYSFKCYWWMEWWKTNWSLTIVGKEIITWMVGRIWDVKRKSRSWFGMQTSITPSTNITQETW